MTHDECDLLIVGGTDSSLPAAAQAARMGVGKIIVVNDIEWFGGQWSAAGLSMIDEMCMIRGRWGMYPRSGVHLELIRYVRDYNRKHFGVASPGNARAYQGTTPTGAATAFQKIVEPYLDGGTGQVRLVPNHRPVQVLGSNNTVTGVIFEDVNEPSKRMTIEAKLTIDASDWGDVVSRSGANYFVGADPRSRFEEVGAPEILTEERRTEVNSMNWCPVLIETGRDATIERPADYDERLYYNSSPLTAKEFDDLAFPPETSRGRALPFVDTVSLGGYTVPGPDNIYTHRRLIDRRHNNIPGGRDVTVIVRPPQDYPLNNFPKRLVDALERNEPGASKKTIPEMSYEQRALVFEDAKQYYLGYVYFLQTTAHERMGDYPESFKYMELSDEFGTKDKLPPKPYIREGLRLDALYNVRRQDFDTGRPWASPDTGWEFTEAQFTDAGFAWQNWFDYHVTRRVFQDGDNSKPWATAWKEDFEATEGFRGGFPLRGLVPRETQGLVGSFLNIGNSSIVCSGLRWHNMMPAVGQASAALAAVALQEGVSPHDVAQDLRLVRKVQKNLVSPPGGSPGLALIGYEDLQPDVDSDRLFEAANLLGVRGIMPPRRGTLMFGPYDKVSRRELAGIVARAYRTVEHSRPYAVLEHPAFADVASGDPDRVYIESLQAWGAIGADDVFKPDEPARWRTLNDWLTALNMPPEKGLLAENIHGGKNESLSNRELWRWDVAVHVWAAIKDLEEFTPNPGYVSKPEDARLKPSDPYPWDKNKNGIPDWLDPPSSVSA